MSRQFNIDCVHCKKWGRQVKCNPNGYAVIWNPYFGINEPYDQMCEIQFKEKFLKKFNHSENYYYWKPTYPKFNDCFPPNMCYVLQDIKKNFNNGTIRTR